MPAVAREKSSQPEFPFNDLRQNPARADSDFEAPEKRYGQLSLPKPISIGREDLVLSSQSIPSHLISNQAWEGSFVGGLGSHYQVSGNGCTQRTQYRHVKVFTEPVVHDPSQLTVYANYNSVVIARFGLNFQQMYLEKLSGTKEYLDEQLFMLNDGSLGWISFPKPEFFKLQPLTHFIHYSKNPEVGLAPIELWWESENGGISWHEGHSIVRVNKTNR